MVDDVATGRVGAFPGAAPARRGAAHARREAASSLALLALLLCGCPGTADRDLLARGGDLEAARCFAAAHEAYGALLAERRAGADGSAARAGAARCLVRLGRATEATADVQTLPAPERAALRLLEARARARDGDLSGAAAAVRPVLDDFAGTDGFEAERLVRAADAFAAPPALDETAVASAPWRVVSPLAVRVEPGGVVRLSRGGRWPGETPAPDGREGALVLARAVSWDGGPLRLVVELTPERLPPDGAVRFGLARREPAPDGLDLVWLELAATRGASRLRVSAGARRDPPLAPARAAAEAQVVLGAGRAALTLVVAGGAASAAAGSARASAPVPAFRPGEYDLYVACRLDGPSWLPLDAAAREGAAVRVALDRVCLHAGAAAGGDAGDPGEVSALAEGSRLHAQGDLAGAAPAYRRAVRASPLAWPARLFGALARLEAGDPGPAARDLAALLPLLPAAETGLTACIQRLLAAQDPVTASEALADALVAAQDAGQRRRLQQVLTTVVSMAEGTSATLGPLALARVYLAARRHDEALAAAERAQQGGEVLAGLLLHGEVLLTRGVERGDAREARADLQAAALDYQRATQHGPSDPRVFSGLGRAHFFLGQRAPAVRFLQRALELEPDSAETCRYLGRSLVLAGEPAQARVVLERAVAMDPTNRWGHVHLAEALEGEGEVARARGCLRLGWLLGARGTEVTALRDRLDPGSR